VATASVQFLRTLGGMVWVSVMGVVLNLTLFGRLKGISGVSAQTPHQAGEAANQLLDPKEWQSIPLPQLDAMRDALAAGLQNPGRC
jgi:hypothetical protein